MPIAKWGVYAGRILNGQKPAGREPTKTQFSISFLILKAQKN
jgi:hypothetical protein